MSEHQIELGALSPKLKRQIPWIPDNRLVLLQRFADSITLLSLHQILPISETHKARKRLVKKIQQAANDYKESSK